MKIELVSFSLCPFVHRSAIMLAEKGTPFERRDIDLKNKPDWFLAISPRGKVPVLLVDGQPLFESSAINEFLDETHPPRLLPEDPFERARQRAWVEVANDLLLAQHGVFTAPASEVGKATAKLDPVLDRLEDALANGTIDENGFGLVHVALAPALHRHIVVENAFGIRLLQRTRRLAALAQRVVQRPSMTTTVGDDFADRFVDFLVERGTSFTRLQ